MQLQKSSIVSLNAVTETKLVYCLLFFFGTHWYRARIVYFALSIPASVFPVFNMKIFILKHFSHLQTDLPDKTRNFPKNTI